jgi:hypothetical protein
MGVAVSQYEPAKAGVTEVHKTVVKDAKTAITFLKTETLDSDSMNFVLRGRNICWTGRSLHSPVGIGDLGLPFMAFSRNHGWVQA